MAFLAVPWVANAQNTLTVADGTTTNQYVPVYGYYADDFLRSQTIYPASLIEEGAEAVGMNGGSISSMTFYLTSPATGSWGSANFVVRLTEVAASTLSGWGDVTNAVTVYNGALDGTQSTMTVEFTTPYTYNGGNLLLEIYSDADGSYKACTFSGITSAGASWQGYNSSSWQNVTGSVQNFIPKTTFTFSGGTPITCRVVSNLAATGITAHSAVLTWEDLNNTGASYTIYNGSEAIATVPAGTYTYTVTGLDANTNYNLGVQANCSATDASAVKSVTIHTDCDVIALPYTNDFENEPFYTYGGTPYLEAIAGCWSRYNDGTSYNYYPYIATSTSSAHSGSNYYYFYAGTNASYPNVQMAILPPVDPTVNPMNGNMVSFWARYSGATSIQVGTMSDPTDLSTFVLDSTVELTSSYAMYTVKLTSAPATNAYVAFRVDKGSSYAYVYLDDVTLEQIPSCWAATDLVATPLTTTTATLAWEGNVENTGDVTYNVYNGETLVASGVTSPYTLTGLEMDQDYVLSVVTDCGNNDLARATSISYTHGYCQPNPSSRDGAGLINVSFGTFMAVNNDTHPQSAPFYGNYHDQIGAAILGSESFDMDITWSTGYDYGTIVWVDWNNNLQFEDSEIVYTGEAAGTRPTTLHATIAIPEGTAEGYYRIRVAGADSYFDSYVDGNEEGAHDACFTSTYAAAEDYTLYIGPAPEQTVSFTYLTTDAGVGMGTAATNPTTIHWGDNVLLTSTPATNMRTAAWYAGEQTSVEGLEPIATDTNELEVVVTSDTAFTVVYGYGQFEVNVATANANQARMGSVAGDSPYNNNMYDYGTTATLTATANTGFQFIEWRNEDGTVFSTDNPLVIDEVLQPYSLIGHFGIASYEVAAETEHGHVEGLGTYTFGSSATLTAVADPHYHFVKWADDDMTNAERAYRVIADATFHPVFEPDVYSVTVNGPAVATYTVKDAEGNETNSFAYTTEATVEAVDIDEHYTFVSWNVARQLSERVYFLNRTLDDATVMLTFDENNDVVIFDSYGENGEHVNATTMTLDEANDLLNNGVYSITDLVDPYVYEWNEVLSTSNPYTFAVENDIVLTPVYDAEQMTLTIASNDVDMGSVSFADYEGTSVTVDFMTQVLVHAEAVPGGYSNFTGWYNGTELVSTSADYWVTVEQPMTLTANFSFTEYPVSVAAEPVEAGVANASSLSPQFSDNVTFTATANDHWVFSHWTYADQTAWLSQNAEYSEMVFEALNLVAHFVRDNHTIVATVADASHGTTVVTDENGAEATEPFIHGSYATVSFTEDYGYSFAGWKNQHDEIVSTENPFTFEVTEDTVLTATVSPLPYTVYIDVNPDEDGYIRGGAWVSENDASFTYDYLTEINAQLTNEPVYGYLFDNWTNLQGETVELPMELTQDTLIFANFKKDQFTVTGAVAADYRMMGRVSGTETVDYLEYVTLTASENNGYNFSKWVDAEGNDLDLTATYEEPTTGDVYDIYTDVNGASISVLASEARELFAVYDYEYYTVEAQANDANMGTVAINDQPLNPVNLAYSQTVTLKADAKEHYHFVQWQDENTDNPRSFILTEPVSFTATFAIDTHTVTLVYKDAEVESIALVPTADTIELSATNTYDYNTELQATIAPKHGYVFAGWSFDGTTVADPSDDFIFTLTQDTTLTALFERDQYTVTVASADATMGSAKVNDDASATVDFESTVTLVATPEYGYDFVSWTNADGDVISTEATYSYTVIDDTALIANFQVHQYTMTALVNDEAMGGVGIGLLDPNAQPINAEATVADGTNTNSYVPVYGYCADDYQRSQVVYPAATMAEAGVVTGSTISKMTFYTSQSSITTINGNWQVNLKETASTSLSSFESGATNVYEGTVNVTNSQMVINFATPYTYNGGNLLVEFIQDEVSSSYPGTTFYGQRVIGASVQGYNYGSVDAISASQRNFMPKTTFGYSYVPGPEVNNFTSEATAQGAYNTAASFKAQANYGYHFVDWTNSADEHLTDNPQEVTILRDITLTANFAKNTYHIVANTQLNHGATGTVAITGTTEDNIDVEYLDEVTLTATVAEPYRLLRWEDQNGNSLGNANPLTFAVTTDSTITAVLDFEVYTLTANTEDIEMGGVYVDDPNNAPDPVEIFNETFESLGDWTLNSCHSSTGITNTSSFRFYYSTNPPQYLISPEFNASGDLTVTFNYKVQSATYTESFQFGYSTTDNDPSSFTWETEVFTNNISYTQYATTVPAATKYMAIKYTAYDKYVLYIDDFVVLEAPAPGSVPSLATSSADVAFSSSVAVTATPAEHYHFVGWKGANVDTVTALGTDANPTIYVAGDSTLTALFDGDQMPMTYQVNNAVRGAVEGPATAEYNTEVTISAVPAHGYEFTGWDDDVTAEATRTVTVKGTDAENTYKANFGFQTYDFNVTVENGTVSVTNDMEDVDGRIPEDATEISNKYYYGTEVELTFTANEHYHFVVNDANVTTYTQTVTFLNEPEAINAVAFIDTHNVVLAVNDETLGTIEGAESGEYIYGTELTFTATPAEHQHFVNWSDGEESAERTITVEGDLTLTANFFVNSYEVAVEADAEQGTAEWNDGTTASIAISASDRWDDGWGGGANLSVMQNGTEVLNIAHANGANGTVYTCSVDPHAAVDFIWHSGTYDGENSFTVNYNGADVYTQAESTLNTVEDGTVLFTIPAHTTVLPNADVTFTATPNPGYEFANWTMGGEEVSTENPYTMAITENTTLTANFNFVGFAITVASNNDVMGTAYINDDAEQTTYVAAYEEDVVLNAVPEYGYIFENWTLNGAEVSTEATATVQATTAADYIANFNFDNFDLNVAVAEGQEERGTVTGAGNYPYGTQVEIAAVANDGYLFTNWNDGVTTATRTVTVDGATEYVASFRTDATYTVTVIAENGTVSGTGSDFIENDLVSLNAVPATGYRFVSYTDAEGTVLSENAAYSFNITSDVTLTATFAALPYNVVLNADATMGSVTGAGEYTYGTQATIEAVANEGYYFTQWSDNVTTNPRTIVVIEDVELTAQFEAIPAAQYYIGAVAVNGTVEGAGTYEDGTQVSLTATANNCYQFTGWMVNNQTVSTANPYVFTATENVTVMATFEALSLSGEETQVACESYTWNGQTYTASGDYTASLTSNGCDSVATLHLTINTPVNTTETAIECQSYTWNVNNQTYTTSGTYTASIEDANGCTATATLNLTINGAYDELISASSCGDYEWNGITYDEEGVYTQTFTAANGCDSVVTLILTINEPAIGGESNATACGSYEWNGEFYTQSGDYTLNLMAANGCDSIVTLHLTINQAVDVTVFDTACDTYTWNANNVEYTSTGTYLYTFEQGTATGCDSTVTLYLTINNSVNTTIEATATGSYEWNDTVYTESGEYTFNGQTVNGCDSIVTLLLTIETQNYTVTVNVNNSAMGSVNPAGEITVAAGETFTATAEANEGFRFIGWSNGATTETVTIVVESDTTLTANFEAITYTINATANDETMGYVTGSGEYSHGAVVTLEAVANNGYHFVRWSDGTTNAHYEFNAIADVTLTAYFEADEVGIEDVDGADVNIYSADSKIIVKGAENLDIYIYDVNGRVVRTQAAATETVEFTMNTTGVYLVKVGSAPAKRVVVVR
ncbi:MAG: InlB B-repeat-containing protein [Bacteroidales bacterium]|nr:InlB B-repeat-containing protein [Bacteroidales bacterium]